MASQNRTHASDRSKAVVDIPTVPTEGGPYRWVEDDLNWQVIPTE